MNENAAIENVSDTALWVAVYRAMETDRPDALFRDPLAKVLAGERGMSIVRAMPHGEFTAVPIIVRTCVLDEMILSAIRERGIKTVVNLGAGLDSRPYRLDLPAELRWIEVDFPALIEYKEGKLATETPRCRLERVKLDLSDAAKRRTAFASLDVGADSLVITEGFVLYLDEGQVGGLAKDIRDLLGSRWWLLDYCSPELLAMIKKWWDPSLKAANAEAKFSVADGMIYFRERGWRLVTERFGMDEGLRLKRTPPIAWYYKVLGLFMSRKRKEMYRRFTSFALLERA